MCSPLHPIASKSAKGKRFIPSWSRHMRERSSMEYTLTKLLFLSGRMDFDPTLCPKCYATIFKRPQQRCQNCYLSNCTCMVKPYIHNVQLRATFRITTHCHLDDLCSHFRPVRFWLRGGFPNKISKTKPLDTN